MRLDEATLGWSLPLDRGAAGLYHAITRCQSRRSVLYVTAHPDDEDAAALAFLSRGLGARTVLLSLTRGESGDNAVGDDEGDALGLRRTEELIRAGAWLGLDALLLGPFFDFGFSKRADEAFSRWGRERVVATVVEAIRRARPLLVMSRFSGGEADGHGHHRAVGLAVQEAFAQAGDAAVAGLSGLAPYRAERLYVWAETGPGVALPVGATLPMLGMTAGEIGAEALAEHRSQTEGKRIEPAFDEVRIYRCVAGTPLPEGAQNLFAGVSTAHALHAEIAPRFIEALRHVATGEQAVAPLAEALDCVRSGRMEGKGEDVLGLAELERCIERALACAAEIALDATATATGDAPPARFYEPFPTLSGAVAGVPFVVDVRSRGALAGQLVLRVPDGWEVERIAPTRFRVIPVGAAVPAYRERTSAADIYDHADDPLHVLAAPPVSVEASFVVAERLIGVVRPVRARRVDAPHARVVLRPLPPAELVVSPHVVLTRPGDPSAITVSMTAARRATVVASIAGEVQSSVPYDGHATDLVLPPMSAGRHVVEVSATIGEGRVDASIDTRLETPRFERARIVVLSAPIEVDDCSVVAYIPGPGDGIPTAVRALGLAVTTVEGAIDDAALAGASVIVVGLHAYAANPHLRAATGSLLAAARAGARVIVLGQTHGYDPRRDAPYPATLPHAPEEVCEETAPVVRLALDHPLLTAPNRIGDGDFTGWVEQRGSKLWSEWDDRYAPLLESHDAGQPPQRGLLLTAPVGTGSYVYCGLALHRQLAHGVLGGYRLIANLLST